MINIKSNIKAVLERKLLKLKYIVAICKKNTEILSVEVQRLEFITRRDQVITENQSSLLNI